MSNLDKNLVKKRFKQSFTTYSKNAIVQKHMTDILLSNLIAQKGEVFDRAFEIGCGTGFLTKSIVQQLEYKELFVNDIVEDALTNAKKISPNIVGHCGDCEKIVYPENLDLVISSATFQWVENLDELLNKISESLSKDGTLAFSTFAKGNLYQIKELTGKSLDYYTKNELHKILSDRFNVLYFFEEEINMEFDSAIEILMHLKQSGVNSLGTTKWTKSQLKRFVDLYSRLFRSGEKLILTYKPLYFVLESK